MHDTRAETSLKTNVLPFPALKHAPPDPPRPTLVRGIITLALLFACAALIGMTIWSLIAL